MSNTLATRLFISACALTRTTELAAGRVGASFFLPALFVLRYANMGALAPALFAHQLAAARSFQDERWCGYWDAIAEQHLTAAEQALLELGAPISPGLLDAAARLGSRAPVAPLREPLALAAPILLDHGPQPSAQALEQIIREHSTNDPAEQLIRAYTALDAWIKAITYYQVSAFPGHTPARTRAYWRSRRLFDALVTVLAPSLGVTIEHIEIPVEGDLVRGYLVLPPGAGPHPTVLLTNGLEGTVQELLIPLLRYRNNGLGTFVMEMPGSYVYSQPMSGQSQRIYHQVIDHLVDDPRVDADRIGMVGVSFGGYWSTRMAATDPRLRCVVSCGAPTHNSFQAGGSLGIPEIITQALRGTTHATSLLHLTRKLRELSLREMYRKIHIPLLVINGDHDTLLSTQDSVELAEHAHNATLKLYPDDDHCAMRHYHEWLDESQRWLHDHLGRNTTPQP
ncbi:alpha/beta hydrolase [Actinokineospora sp. PR83]|uniref:alpha/beta hydrolase n=1 Tax=Actinokineospora sp. PR83 TaxID=2884908 RepID=UPI001F3540E7|nr:alpha/beta hydrolase [Actinokineospora sp. PR83]MCG8917705.1 alpha/beta hydrolase [Actinokineospora sp. PR83]